MIERNDHELRIGIGAPGLTVVETVEFPVRAKNRIKHPLCRHRSGEGLDGHEVRVVVEPRPFYHASLPIPPEQAVVEVRGKTVRLLKLRPVAEYRSRTGSAPPLPDGGKLRRRAVWIVNERRSRRWQVFGPGVVYTLVARMCRIKLRAHLLRHVVVVEVGEVVPDEIRPAEIARLLRLIDLIVAARSPSAFAASIRPNLAPIDDSRDLIHAHAPGIAAAHAVNFRTCVRRAGREKIALGNFIGAVWLRTNADDLSAQVVGIRRRLLRVPRLLAFAFVERRVAFGIAVRVSVIAGGDVNAAVRAKLDRACMVAAFPPLLAKGEHDLLTLHIEHVTVHHEPAEPLALHVFRRMVEVDPVVVGELRIEREAEQPILIRRCHLHGASLDDGFRVRFPNAEFAGDLDEKDATIGGEFQLHRLRHARGEDFDFVAAIGRSRRLRGKDSGKKQAESGKNDSGHRPITARAPIAFAG